MVVLLAIVARIAGRVFRWAPAATTAQDQRNFNLTCVSQPINSKSTLAYGVLGNCGPNSPIQSVHPGGANVLMADGSVHFLSEALDFTILCNLANRDDGNAIPPM